MEKKEMTKETNIYVCRRLKLLDFLQKKGFEVIDTIPDYRNPRFKCWTFQRTPELLAAVEEYYEPIK